MSLFDAISRVPKILEANVNSVIHKDTKTKPVTIPNVQAKPADAAEKDVKSTNVKPGEILPDYIKQNDVKPKNVSQSVSDLEKELMEESIAGKTATK